MPNNLEGNATWDLLADIAFPLELAHGESHAIVTRFQPNLALDLLVGELSGDYVLPDALVAIMGNNAPYYRSKCPFYCLDILTARRLQPGNNQNNSRLDQTIYPELKPVYMMSDSTQGMMADYWEGSYTLPSGRIISCNTPFHLPSLAIVLAYLKTMLVLSPDKFAQVLRRMCEIFPFDKHLQDMYRRPVLVEQSELLKAVQDLNENK